MTTHETSKVDATRPAKREKTGGRAAGVPNKATREIKDIAKAYGPAAIEAAARLAGLVSEGEGKAESEQARLSALQLILDRGYGKATQAITGEDGGAIQHQFTQIILCGPEGDDSSTH